MTTLYFAYGSNLLDSEIRKDARDAEPIGSACVFDYRLVFWKHSTSRHCDAASIEPLNGEVVWGCLYSITERDRDALRRRERGYREVEVEAQLRPPGAGPNRVVRAITFVAEQRCSLGCGPNAPYLALIIEGARARELPSEYIHKIETTALPGRPGRGEIQ